MLSLQNFATDRCKIAARAQVLPQSTSTMTTVKERASFVASESSHFLASKAARREPRWIEEEPRSGIFMFVGPQRNMEQHRDQPLATEQSLHTGTSRGEGSSLSVPRRVCHRTELSNWTLGPCSAVYLCPITKNIQKGSALRLCSVVCGLYRTSWACPLSLRLKFVGLY